MRAYLHAFAEEDVPYPEREGEGEGVGEDGDEPLGGVHGGVDALLLEVGPQPGEQLLHQPLKLEQVLLHQGQADLERGQRGAWVCCITSVSSGSLMGLSRGCKEVWPSARAL